MSAASTRQLVVFSLGDEEYALPITQVHEIKQLDTVPAAGDPAIEAIAKIDQRLVVPLDPVGLFGNVEALAVAAA